jgi:hypothetical protein
MQWYNWLGYILMAYMTFGVAFAGFPTWKGWLIVIAAALLIGLRLN